MLVRLFAALVLVKGINADICNGSIIVREPVIQNRSIRATFTSTSLDQYTAVWTIGAGSHWFEQVQFPYLFNTLQNSSTCSLTITNYINFITSISFNLRVALKGNQTNTVCYKDQSIEMTELGGCGNLAASDTFIREERPVDLELQVKDGQEYRSFTLLFMNDADDQAILHHENTDRGTRLFTYTLDSPRSDGIYLVMCGAEVKTYSTSLRLKIAVKPSVPELKNLKKEPGRCESCIYVFAEETNGIWINCNVSGGTDPKNVTISVGTHTSQAKYYKDLYMYMSYFKIDQLGHGSKVKCAVLNPALDHPLTTTTYMYIYRQKRPDSTEIKLYDIVAGGEATIECVSTDMRPASNLTLDVEGISCNPNQDDRKNNNTDTYNVTATCSFTANKNLHNKTVKCCLGDQSHSHCQTKQLNVLFPPDHVEAKKGVLRDDEKKFNSTAVNCYVSSGNPPCTARWEVPPEIIDYRTENFKSAIGLNDGNEILSTIFLNLTRLNHGQQIQCLAVCGNLEVKSNVMSLNVPGAPLMKVFPGNMVTKREGESLTLNCTVDSIPKSNISWKHGNDIQSESRSAGCDSFSKCYQSYHFESLVKSQTGNYICIAHNDQFESSTEIVTLKVVEPDSLTGHSETILNKTWFIPAVAGGCAAVLIVIIIVVVFAVRRRKKTKKNSMEPNGHNEGQDAGEHIQGEIEEEHGGNIDGEQEASVENVMYATVVKDNVRPSTSKDQQVSHDDSPESNECGNASSVKEQVQTDNTYAQVLPRAERQKQSQKVQVYHDDGQESNECDNTSSVKEQVQTDNTYAQVLPRAERQKQPQKVKATTSGEKELVYLDIEFNKAMSGSKVKGGQQNDVERTEYVSIDFSKKAPADS